MEALSIIEPGSDVKVTIKRENDEIVLNVTF